MGEATVNAPSAEGVPAPGTDGEAITQVQHARSIEYLALQLGRSVAEVTPVYALVLSRLLVHARVTDYLPVLVSKRVRSMLQH